MKSERLLYALSDIADELVEQTAPLQTSKSGWKKMLPMAACFAVILLAGYCTVQLHEYTRSLLQPQSESITSSDTVSASVSPETSSAVPSQSTSGSFSDTDVLPEIIEIMPESQPVTYAEDGLQIITPNMHVDGMGYEGGMMNIGAINTQNPYAPWSPEVELEALPVFYNDLAYSWYDVIINIDIEELRERVRRTAESLGMDMDTLVIQDDSLTDEQKLQTIESWKGWSPDGGIPAGILNPHYAFCVQDGIRIDTYVNSTTIIFDTPIAMPAGAAIKDASTDQRQLAADWIREEFAELLGESTQINLHSGDPTLSVFNENDLNYLSFYRPAETTKEAIVNHYFNRVNVYEDFDGKHGVYLIRIYHENLSQSLGDYPIITAAQAKDRLLAGEYLTTAPDSLPIGEATIAQRVELVYRNGNGEQYFLPYYKFFVVQERSQYQTYPEGMEDYGAYYVPALSDEYLSDVTLWDGGFN